MQKIILSFLLCAAAVQVFAQTEGVVVLSDTVTGNQEQPKVLYIVPWQPAQDDTILTQPLTTKLHRDIFSHIERPEHLRELQYLEQLTPAEKNKSQIASGGSRAIENYRNSVNFAQAFGGQFNMFNDAVKFFQDGGVFMYPIAVVLVVGMAVAVERWVVLSAARSSNRRAFDRILPLLKKRDYNAIIDMGRNADAPISRIIAAGLVRMQHTPRRDEIEYAMEEGVMEAVPRLEKRTSYIATLANIATLLGLLGTIIGLIQAFTAVANADPAEKAALLSQSIAVAMNTTAFGLIAAIPLLLLHTAIQNKTTEIVDSLEMAGVKTLNIMSSSDAFSGKTRASDAAPANRPVTSDKPKTL